MYMLMLALQTQLLYSVSFKFYGHERSVSVYVFVRFLRYSTTLFTVKTLLAILARVVW